jgi:hypothetical protein
MQRIGTAALAAFLVLAGNACSQDPTSPAEVETSLLDVIPPGGATGVDPNAPIVVEFDHPIGYGMAEYAMLHEGGIDGPQVDGTWVLSEDRNTLTFTPDRPLKPGTAYVIHVGGGIMDEHGHHLNFERYGFGLGGAWCTGEQLGPRGGMGPGGTMGTHHHQGAGWQHANGMYGMFFTFLTA